MSNNFLGISGGANLTDGTANLYLRSARIKNLTPNNILKTSGVNSLVAVETINISEVAGLQTEIDEIKDDIKNTIQNPMISNLNMNNFNIINVNTISGQPVNSQITIIDETVTVRGTTETKVGHPSGTAYLEAFDTIITTSGSNPVQCRRTLNMSNNVMTNVGGISLVGASRLISNSILTSAACNSAFSLNGNNITNVSTIFGITGATQLTMANETVNIQGGFNTNIGTGTGTATINALNTIITTTGANPVQCLKILNMSNNNIINANNISASQIETQGNIYLYKSISPNIYVNASLMRQTTQILYTGVDLTPTFGNSYQFAPSFIPTSTASNISGATFIPGNTMAPGNTFKLSCFGTMQEGNNGIIQNFRLYALNINTLTDILLISINNTELVTTLTRWKLDIVFQIRTIGVGASMVINGDLAIGNTNQLITNTTVNFDSTAGQQLIGTIYFDTNNINNNFTTDISTLSTL
jgi:hypothetical protein